MQYQLILLAVATAILFSMTADFYTRARKELRNPKVPRTAMGFRQQGIGYAVCWAFFACIWLLHTEDAVAMLMAVSKL